MARTGPGQLQHGWEAGLRVASMPWLMKEASRDARMLPGSGLRADRSELDCMQEQVPTMHAECHFVTRTPERRHLLLALLVLGRRVACMQA